jgi:hypothetical protein
MISDARITMGQRTWHVHRWVICKQSEYFEKALEGNFKASRIATPILISTIYRLWSRWQGFV